MAALNRPTKATYTIHESCTVDTTDREDHSFCGIMFPIKAKRYGLPIDKIIINSISVRGRLGPLTVWVTKDEESYRDEEAKRKAIEEAATATAAAAMDASETSLDSASSKKSRYNLRARLSKKSSSASQAARPKAVRPVQGEISMKKRDWIKLYEKEHGPSFREYTELDLSANPIVLTPGQVRGIYIHSTLPGDEAIVYDNRHKHLTHDDSFITILPGRAHVSETPFGKMPIWGWGNAWRDSREFVGRVSYGCVYRLWNPSEHINFGRKFRYLALTLFGCQRRWESPFSMVGDDIIFYILNMCKWDWANDDFQDLAEQQKKLQKIRRQREALLAATVASSSAAAAAASNANDNGEGNFTCTLGSKDDEEEDCKMPAIVSPEVGSTAPSSFPTQDMRIDSYDEDDEDDDSDEAQEDGSDADDSDEYDSDAYDDYRGINPTVFNYRDYEEEESDGEGEARRERETETRRRSWVRSQFARIHVLNALASMNDGGEDVVGMDVDEYDDDGDEDYVEA